MKHGSEIIGIVGTVATFTLTQVNAILSLVCGVATAIVIIPKACQTLKSIFRKNESPAQNNNR